MNREKWAMWATACESLDLTNGGRKAWRLLNNLANAGSVRNPVPLKTAKGGLASSDNKKCEALNHHFASVNKAQPRPKLDNKIKLIRRLKEKSYKKAERRSGKSVVFDSDFTLDELETALRKCKSRKTPGLDQITNEMLVNVGPWVKSRSLSLPTAHGEKVLSLKHGS